MLERLIRDGNGGTVQETRRFLENVRGKIPRSPDKARMDDATVDVWREKIAGVIVALEEEAGRNRDTDSGRPFDRPQQP